MATEPHDETPRVGVVSTIENKCKRCYSCIRNCPSRAIRVRQGQAWVMEERCVACGNCVRVCAQGAKRVEDGIAPTRALLKEAAPVCLVMAPSFPVAFAEMDPGCVVAAARRLGFAEVIEVAFGAELVSRAYRRLLESRPQGPLIATACPSLVRYIEKYYPRLVPYLAPIVSPMIAVSRAIKQVYRPGARVVFAGPCVAKKQECADPAVAGDTDAVLTFPELRQMFEDAGILPGELAPEEFDGPAPMVGRIFPVSGGLLRTAALECDLLCDDIVATEGRARIIDLLDSLEAGHVRARFFDLLFCVGCINGPVMPREMSVVEGKERIAEFANRRARVVSEAELEETLKAYDGLDLSRTFSDEHVALPMPSEEEIRVLLRLVNKEKPEDELNCGACGYRSCREKAIAVHQGLAENEMCLPFIIDRLTEYNEKIKETQKLLFRAEKLASVGRLAAGIAHEINNPLGGILLFADILTRSGVDDEQKQKLKTIIDETIRCREIVKGVLDFSRQTEPRFGRVSVPDLLDRVFGLVEKQALFQNIEVRKRYASRQIPLVPGDTVQLQQVFLNIIVNAAQAIIERGTITVEAFVENGFVNVSIADTGRGIPEEDLEKIFDPFFTTKGPKKGTGLGLSTSHGIIENHKGVILVESKVGVGSTFTIRLPMERLEEDGTA